MPVCQEFCLAGSQSRDGYGIVFESASDAYRGRLAGDGFVDFGVRLFHGDGPKCVDGQHFEDALVQLGVKTAQEG